MNELQKNLVGLACASLGTRPFQPKNRPFLNWDNLYQAAAGQGMIGQLYPAVEKLPDENLQDSQALTRWKKHVMQVFLHRVLNGPPIAEILKAFRSIGIPLIILKGLAIARYYEMPQYRSMSDLDILVRSEDIPTAKQVLEDLGYQLAAHEDHHPMHLEYTRAGGIFVELHRALVHPGLLGHRELDEWYEHIWRHRVEVESEGLQFSAMGAEDELINQIIHFASHTVLIGAKFKHLFDIALLIQSRRNSLDWGYIDQTLKTTGFHRFAGLVLSACASLFHIPVPASLASVPERIHRRFVDDLLNVYSVQQLPEDWKAWCIVVNDLQALVRYPVLSWLVWFVLLRAQFQAYGPRLGFVVRNANRNIRGYRNKARLVRSFGLLGAAR